MKESTPRTLPKTTKKRTKLKLKPVNELNNILLIISNSSSEANAEKKQFGSRNYSEIKLRLQTVVIK